MKISLAPLDTTHFPLLLKWLETPHVKKFWDPHVTWTPSLIHAKYSDYVKGYKIEGGIAKRMRAFVICVDDVPVGYVQGYDAHDFPRSNPLMGLKNNLSAFDVFIGESDFLKRTVASKALELFFKILDEDYAYTFADPDPKNRAAIRLYQKAGFKEIAPHTDVDTVWMLRKSPLAEHLEQQELSLLDVKVRASPALLEQLIDDSFREFGSSGVMYTKQDLLALLPLEKDRKFTVDAFEVQKISKDVALMTYVLMEENGSSLRSSLWKGDENKWRMIFHQGTTI